MHDWLERAQRQSSNIKVFGLRGHSVNQANSNMSATDSCTQLAFLMNLYDRSSSKTLSTQQPPLTRSCSTVLVLLMVTLCPGRYAFLQSKVWIMRPFSSKMLPDPRVSIFSFLPTTTFLICFGSGSTAGV